MNRSTAIRPTLVIIVFACLLVALLMPYERVRAEDGAVSASLWIPYAHSDKEDGNTPIPQPTSSPTTSPTPSTTPSPTTSPTTSPTASPTTSPTPSPTTSPTPESETWTMFADTEWNTNSASLVTDAEGGIHLAYHYYESVGDGAPTTGVYAYCASDCETAANWQRVTLGGDVNEIQLELTADGRPRILYRVAGENNGQVYYYAECDANCTQASSWNGAAIATTEGMAIIEFNDDEQPQRYFELDPEGHPRFVYSDSNSFREPDHIGTYYAFCDSGCAAASNWSEVRINKNNENQGPYRSEDFHYPALAFTPSGQPRVLADGVSMEDESALYYVACDSGCDVTANWQSVPLFERGSGPNVAYDIEINAQGQPRIAYFDGARLNSEGEWLYYGWCNEACTTAGNWQRFDFNFVAKEGQEPDLELDAEGKPHIAYAVYAEGGLAYSWCESACESADGQWTHKVVETRNDLATAWDVAYPPHCDGGVWDGLTPSFALDKDGNAVFAYDATYHARCWYNVDTGEWEPFSQFHLIVRTVRTYFLPKP